MGSSNDIPTRADTCAWFSERISSFGDRIGFIVDDLEFTYSEIATERESYQRLLQESAVRHGAIVAIRAEFGVPSTAAILALIEIQAIIVPICNSFSPNQIDERIAESKAAWLLDLTGKKRLSLQKLQATSDEPHELVNRIRASQNPGLILFSSGSVGKPKAMIHDLASLISVYESRKPRRLRVLCFLLFDHIGGLNTLFNCLASGSTLVVPTEREPVAIAGLIAQHQIHLLPTSPTFLNLMLISNAVADHDLGSLKIITYGSEPMPSGLLRRVRSAFPKTRLLQTFGTSETGITRTQSKSSASTMMRLDDPNGEHKIVDGELWLRSKTQILGYLNHDSNRFTDDGWFKTGDIVEQSDDGYLRIVARREELINVGGLKVAPIEVEGILLELDEIQECRVFGQPNSITGQMVAAEIVAQPDVEEGKLKRAIRKHCRGRLEPFKVPTQIKLVEAGKVNLRFKKQRMES